MLKIKQKIAHVLKDSIQTLSPDTALTEAEIVSFLEYPPDENMGDLALPCFKLARALHKSPVVIAQTLADGLQTDEDIQQASALNGYLNIHLSGNALAARVIPEVLEKGDRYGSPECGHGQTVVFDYCSPNLAKPFHIGHLGTTVIGHSLKMLHQFAGYSCVGINYLGDWGTQFGKLLVAYKLWGDHDAVEQGGVDALVDLYVRINRAIEEDPKLADQARAEFRKMEDGDQENLALWRWLVALSVKANDETLKQLGVTFDSYKGESFYTDKMPAQVQRLRDMGLLKLDNGASIVSLDEYGMPPCLILKSDGATLYPTRDIAAAVYRQQEYHFDKCIYITSNQQILHFKQWFKVVELMGYDWYDKLVHVPYGTVSINGSKLATRTGNVILLRDLFNTAIEKVTEIMEEKNPALKGRSDIAESIGVGAIVFYYLSNNRIKDIDFNIEDALSFEGNTGPYVQYTYARTCSVLEKASHPDLSSLRITDPCETSLLKIICQLEERVLLALRDYEPSVITRYILDVAVAFNKFYHSCPILTAQDPAVKNTRIAITAATKQALGNAFGLICLRKTEKV